MVSGIKEKDVTTFIIGIIIGAFIGWNIPQPQFAKDVQNKVKGYFKKS